MFEVRFYKTGKRKTFNTLQEAKESRTVSGDFVYDTNTGIICTDDEWLWDWEKQDQISPPKKEMRKLLEVPIKEQYRLGKITFEEYQQLKEKEEQEIDILVLQE